MKVQSLGQEDPLEDSMPTHSSILAWRLPWTEESGGFAIWVHKELDMIASEHIHTPRLKLQTLNMYGLVHINYSSMKLLKIALPPQQQKTFGLKFDVEQ